MASCDAGSLARYVWLSALRYPDYQHAACVCVAEHANVAWVIAPHGSELEKGPGSIGPDALHRAFTNWLTSGH